MIDRYIERGDGAGWEGRKEGRKEGGRGGGRERGRERGREEGRKEGRKEGESAKIVVQHVNGPQIMVLRFQHPPPPPPIPGNDDV